MARGLPTLRQRRPGGVAELYTLFKGFADPIRIRILNLLTAGELCVCDIGELLKLPQSSVSRHLAYLRRARLVEVAREGKFAHYRLAQPRTPVHRSLQHCARVCFGGIPLLDAERAAATRRVALRGEEPC